MSAKRRTTALASGVDRRAAIASASRGLELPATSLIAPFVAAINASLPAGSQWCRSPRRSPQGECDEGGEGRSPDRRSEKRHEAKAQRRGHINYVTALAIRHRSLSQGLARRFIPPRLRDRLWGRVAEPTGPAFGRPDDRLREVGGGLRSCSPTRPAG